MRPEGKTIWITGASSGIGHALAVALAPFAPHLLLSARREDRLSLTAAQCRSAGAAEASVIPMDMGSQTSREEAVVRVSSLADYIDILILAGGVSQRGSAIETKPEVARQVMEVNFWASVFLTQAVAPAMLKRRSGQVVAVTSLTGKFGAPSRSTYSASKHALHGWFDSFREEVHDSGVEVTLLVPGWVKTEISENALEANGARHGRMDAGQQNGISAAECARRSLPAIIAGKPEQLVGGRECGGVYLNRLWPGLFRRVLRRHGIG